MPWFAVDDQLHSHPKARAAGLEALGLWTVAGAYAGAYMTDGHVPAWVVDSWGPEARAAAQRLVDARLWDAVDDGWTFRSWSEFQRTRAQVQEDRKKARDRQAARRARMKDPPT